MLPNLVIIGAQKCGTSALHYYLGFHPEISMSQPKELNFFVRQRNWKQGLEWYESHFRERTPVRGESSPNYTNHPRFRGVPRRMHGTIPDAKLIFMVRDPIERIVSAYLHNRAKGRPRRSFEETVADPGGTYLRRSLYYHQIRRFRNFYPRHQLMIVDHDDLLNDRRETLRQVFAFLGVDESFWSSNYHQLKNRSVTHERPFASRLGGRLSPEVGRLSPELARSMQERVAVAAPERPVVTPELREELLSYLAEDIRRFRRTARRDFAHWSV